MLTGLRCAIISDIHGNSEALRKVLAKITEIDKQYPIHFCISLGDHVGGGYDTCGTLSLLHKYHLQNGSKIEFIYGNHDRALWDKEDFNRLNLASRYDTQMIKAELLKEWHLFQELKDKGESSFDLKSVQSSYRHEGMINALEVKSPYIWPMIYPSRHKRSLLSATVSKLVKQYKGSSILYYGHTHIPALIKANYFPKKNKFVYGGEYIPFIEGKQKYSHTNGEVLLLFGEAFSTYLHKGKKSYRLEKLKAFKKYVTTGSCTLSHDKVSLVVPKYGEAMENIYCVNPGHVGQNRSSLFSQSDAFFMISTYHDTTVQFDFHRVHVDQSIIHKYIQKIDDETRRKYIHFLHTKAIKK